MTRGVPGARAGDWGRGAKLASANADRQPSTRPSADTRGTIEGVAPCQTEVAEAQSNRPGSDVSLVQILDVVLESARQMGLDGLIDVGNVRHDWADAGLLHALVRAGPHST